MKSSVLANFDMTYLPVVACLIFLSIFVTMLFWVNRKGSKEIYKKAAALPLERGEDQ